MISYSVQANVALLELRAPPVNAIGFALLDELQRAMQQAIDAPQVRAIVLTGSRERFSAGADLAIFQNIRGDDDAVRVSSVFQQAFQAIEDSPKPVVAAVAGHVLGGALELAMSCHVRLATEDSRFSMPEVNLGINPGAGGTQRLPRLVGLECALEMLLGGRPIDCRKALQLGLIDSICPPEDLVRKAVELAATAVVRKTSTLDEKLSDAAVCQTAFDRAESQLANVRRELIASWMILDAVRTGAEESFQAGLLSEQESFRRCMASQATQNKIYILCAGRETARLPASVASAAEDRRAKSNKAGVVGMGTMGAGIAQALLMAGLEVVVLDRSSAALQAGEERIKDSIQRRVAQGKMSSTAAQEALARLTTTPEANALAGAGLVVEAVFEDVEVKRAAIAELEDICSPETIIATNTSTINLDVLAAGMRVPERLIGMHFFHPAQQMPLVEIVRRRSTPPEIVAAALSLAKSMGKTPVLAWNREGFIVNRLFIPYLTEAFWLMDEGTEPAAIDRAMVDFGFAMGPLQLIDMSGLDILAKTQPILAVAMPWHGGLSEIVADLVNMGCLGQKTQSGVYCYQLGDRTPHPNPMTDLLIANALRRRGVFAAALEAPEIVSRLMLRMVAEAGRLLEESVVARPSDVDVAMVLGTGLADFRGGVLKYAAGLGWNRVLAQLRSYAQRHGPRYDACLTLQKAAVSPLNLTTNV